MIDATDKRIEEMLIDISYTHGRDWWQKIGAIYGPRRIGKMPEFVLNRRLTRTIARARLEHDKIDLSVSINSAYPSAYAKVIIPHELAHFVAWRLYADRGHQTTWKDVMISLGLPPTATIDVRKF